MQLVMALSTNEVPVVLVQIIVTLQSKIKARKEGYNHTHRHKAQKMNVVITLLLSILTLYITLLSLTAYDKHAGDIYSSNPNNYNIHGS